MILFTIYIKEYESEVERKEQKTETEKRAGEIEVERKTHEEAKAAIAERNADEEAEVELYADAVTRYHRAKIIDNVRRTISLVHDTCNEADEFSHITPEEIDFEDLEKHVKKLKLSYLCTQRCGLKNWLMNLLQFLNLIQLL